MIKGVETGDPWDAVVDLALGISGRTVIPAQAGIQCLDPRLRGGDKLT
jgi:hypothetical protein